MLKGFFLTRNEYGNTHCQISPILMAVHIEGEYLEG